MKQFHLTKLITTLFFYMLIAGCQTNSAVYNPARGKGKYILTPPAAESPKLHGPAVFGVRPGSPFLYSIPASGKKTLKYAAEGLPKGLTVNETSGVISGTIESEEIKNYTVTLIASNDLGTDKKAFKIKVGNTICLTPPLGWNSWNCWGKEVDQEKVLASARAMVYSGLKDYGWTYINIDDVWQGIRGGKYNAIQPDLKKFPDMAEMCDEIHEIGLKVGIYSTPWIASYAGCIGGSSDTPEGYWEHSYAGKKNELQRIGEYKFDEADAKQWADWGIDYLKYDWNPNDPESTLRMAKALKGSGRDIVYSLSNTAPLPHAKLFGREVNCFRTAGDLKDRWDEDGSHLNIREQWILHRTWLELGFPGAPGHFPDPDMLVVGHVSTSGPDGQPVPSSLTADEQYSHISLWALWAAPMLIGAPIEMLDDFTKNLLTNTEVLDIHQDEVAIPAKSVLCSPDYEVFVKELAGGKKAIGMFNLKDEDQIIRFNWDMAGLEGQKTLRDAWRQKDIGVHQQSFSAVVPPHGVILITAQ